MYGQIDTELEQARTLGVKTALPDNVRALMESMELGERVAVARDALRVREAGTTARAHDLRALHAAAIEFGLEPRPSGGALELGATGSAAVRAAGFATAIKAARIAADLALVQKATVHVDDAVGAPKEPIVIVRLDQVPRGLAIDLETMRAADLTPPELRPAGSPAPPGLGNIAILGRGLFSIASKVAGRVNVSSAVKWALGLWGATAVVDAVSSNHDAEARQAEAAVVKAALEAGRLPELVELRRQEAALARQQLNDSSGFGRALAGGLTTVAALAVGYLLLTRTQR